MNFPRILPLAACHDLSLAGGKAAGLARLLQAAWSVPPGFCLTTAANREFLRYAGMDHDQWEGIQALPSIDRATALNSIRTRILAASWPPELLADLQEELHRLPMASSLRWAVRSSATHEDLQGVSFAGLYRTELGVAIEEVPQSVLRCWASLWEPRVLDYFSQTLPGPQVPEIAIVVQTMVQARASGVAFSRHPVTSRAEHIVINAVPGLGEPLVAGRVMPDEYVVVVAGTPELIYRHVAQRQAALRVGEHGLVTDMLDAGQAGEPALTEEEVIALARVVKRVESEYRQPVDVEWAIDERGLWLLQARPMTALERREALTDDRCDWSRANFKETLPDIPSPLGLSFLQQFMEEFIIRRYRELGCVIPPGLSSVRIVEGRPYINVTLLQSCVSQLGGRPGHVTEQMGGDGHVPPWLPPPLPIWKRMKAAILMHRTIQRSATRAPSWFEELRRHARHEMSEISLHLTVDDLMARIDRVSRYFGAGEMTFAIVAGVGQALQVFDVLLPRWLGKDWRSLLNAALQGQENIISAGQIRALSEIGDQARQETKAVRFFLATAWNPSTYREQLSGTFCLNALDAFLTEYGHRAIGESDMMTPRFAEDPTYLLEVIRAYVRQPCREPVSQFGFKQEDHRNAALAEINRRCGWRWYRWVIFRWWYRRLCRASMLREANRHALMYYAAVTRSLVLALGHRLTSTGRLSSAEDVFFLTTDEFRSLNDHSPRDWKALVSARRSEHMAFSSVMPPDFISMNSRAPSGAASDSEDEGIVRGVAISAGVVEGPVRLILRPEDIGKVRRGDILVTSIIDPGMVTVFALAGGLVAEMGGTLSHGAIIVREYGVPALVNVPKATRLLKDGDRIRLDCSEGTIRRVGP